METINNLKDLAEFWSADTDVPADKMIAQIQRRAYKDTACGASVSVYFGENAIHNGYAEEAAGLRLEDATGFTIQTIVEGSDATVDSDMFTFPVAVDLVQDWITEMERKADELWREANEGDEIEVEIEVQV